MKNSDYLAQLVEKDIVLNEYVTFEKTLEKMERIIQGLKPWDNDYETLTKEYLEKRKEYEEWQNTDKDIIDVIPEIKEEIKEEKESNE